MLQAVQIAGLFLWISGVASAQDIDPHQPKGANLVLTAMSVEAQVEVGLAVVAVRQDFHNPYANPIDAVYTFPLPPDAAVRHMQLTCGDLLIEGEIMEKAQAREVYEQARHEGRRAGLLEQQRANLFTQHVAGLCPGETVSVDLEYVHPVDYDNSLYTLAFPTTVGGPYFNVPDDLELPPLVTTARRPKPDLDLSVDIHTSTALESIWSDTHAIDIEEDQRGAYVTLTERRVHRDRDFALSWTLATQTPRVDVITHPPTDEAGYIAVTIEPQVLMDVAQQQRRELLFVIDESCSMSGKPFRTAQQTVRRALAEMGHDDTFNLVRFSDGANSLFPAPVRASEANVAAAEDWLDHFGGGGTAMKSGVLHSLNMPGDPDALRLVLMLTDGYIGNADEIFEAVEDNLGDARLFSLGVGSSVNRMLLEGLAEMGRGDVAYALPGTPIEELVEDFYSRIAHPSMTDITLDFGDLDVFDQYPSVIPDLWAGTPIQVVARYWGRGTHDVTIEGEVRGVPYRMRRVVSEDEAIDHEGVRSLWARSRIHDLKHHRSLSPAARRSAITETALAHHLVSEYTSLVAAEQSPSTCGAARSEFAVPNRVPYGVDPRVVANPSSSYRPVRYRGSTEIDFEGVDVSGELVKPQGTLTLDRKRATLNPLVALRDNFGDEIRDTVSSGSPFSDLEFHPAPLESTAPLNHAVASLLRRYGDAMAMCVAPRLAESPGIGTQVELVWSVVNGRARDVELVSGDRQISECVVGRIERFQWHEIEGEVRWTFELGG